MLPPSLQDSLPAGWLAFAGRASTLWIATKGFRSQSHPPFLDLSWRKGSFIVEPPSQFTSFDHLVGAGEKCWRHSEAWALTVFRLITSSNLVGSVTGKSSGLSPLRIRPT